ncbi:MAG: glycoside hydrolase family 29, partial [Candidatus Nephrothrix sp. EaCA]
MKEKSTLLFLFFCLWLTAAAQKNPPAPYGKIPAERQMRWHELERYCFLHFTTTTFTDKEWGEGSEPENIFNPSDFDAEQIISAIARNGFKAAILT